MDERVPTCEFCASKFWDIILRKFGEVPCFSCRMPELWPQNAKAWEVFAVASSQMRVVGMGTPLGLEFDAIDRAMDAVGVHPDDQGWMWHRVRRVGEEYANFLRKRQEAEHAAKDKNRKTTKSSAQPPQMIAANAEAAAKMIADDVPFDV